VNITRESIAFFIIVVEEFLITTRDIAGRERVGTAFPHLFHVLLRNEFEAALKWLVFLGAFPHLFCQHHIPDYKHAKRLR